MVGSGAPLSTCLLLSLTYHLFMAENPQRAPGSRSISPEAIVGFGITIASLGVLFLLLGWAQLMRGVPDASFIWLALGAALFIVGTIVTLLARARRR